MIAQAISKSTTGGEVGVGSIAGQQSAYVGSGQVLRSGTSLGAKQQRVPCSILRASPRPEERAAYRA